MMLKSKAIAGALVAMMAMGTLATPSMARSRGYCDAYARDYASRKAGGKQVLTGAVLGAGVGALAGAIVGGNHAVTKGAVIGGVGGTVVGGANANKKWKKYYNRAYRDCRTW